MDVFYSNPAGRRHLEMRGPMHECVESLAKIQDDPQMLLTMEADVFGQNLDLDDSVLAGECVPVHRHFWDLMQTELTLW